MIFFCLRSDGSLRSLMVGARSHTVEQARWFAVCLTPSTSSVLRSPCRVARPAQPTVVTTAPMWDCFSFLSPLSTHGAADDCVVPLPAHRVCLGRPAGSPARCRPQSSSLPPTAAYQRCRAATRAHIASLNRSEMRPSGCMQENFSRSYRKIVDIESEQGKRPARRAPTSTTWPATGLRKNFTFFFFLRSDRKRDRLGAGQPAGATRSDIDYLARHGT